MDLQEAGTVNWLNTAEEETDGVVSIIGQCARAMFDGCHWTNMSQDSWRYKVELLTPLYHKWNRRPSSRSLGRKCAIDYCLKDLSGVRS